MNRQLSISLLTLAAITLTSSALAQRVQPDYYNADDRGLGVAVAAPLPVIPDNVIYSKMDYAGGWIVTGGETRQYMSSDDYTSTLPAGTTALLAELQFFGGVATDSVGTTLVFDFFDESQQFISGFIVELPADQKGWRHWSIAPAAPVSIPAAGTLAIGVVGDTTAGWYTSAPAASVGSTADSLPGVKIAGTPLNHKFTLAVVPEPGTLGLLLLFGAFLRRR